MMMRRYKYVMIPVFPRTKERLDKSAEKRETYDELVNRILTLFEKVKPK